MALILCENASFGYEGSTAISGLDFAINKGDYLCVVGENGSGKSTLIKGLLGLLTPLSGQVLFGEGLRSEEIGYLPQQTAAQKDFPASVYEVVLSGRLSSLGMRPFYSPKDRQIAKEHMQRLQIEDLKNRCYRELSGGQQQRVLLARALCATKAMLLLDEPVSGLDPLVTQHLYNLIQGINKDTGITVVMVSHDVAAAVRYASHILHLQNTQGFYGTTEAYVQSPLGKAFLGGGADV